MLRFVEKKSRVSKAESRPLEVPEESKRVRHSWGAIVRTSAQTPRAEQVGRQSKFPHPYSATFEWPQQELSRVPGSGEFEFDTVRKGGYWKPSRKATHGLLPYLLSRESSSLVEELSQGLQRWGLFGQEQDKLDKLAALFYEQQDHWTRANRNELCENDIQMMIDQGWITALSSDNLGTMDEANIQIIFSLLTVEELHMLVKKVPSKLKKLDLVNLCVQRRHGLLPSLLQVTGGVLRLSDPVFHLLLRFHQWVFCKSNLEMEEAIDFLNCSKIPSMSFPLEDNHKVACKQTDTCWETLKCSLDLVASVADQVPRGDQESVFGSLHDACNRLFNLTASIYCPCWMMQRSIANLTKVAQLGINLLERERRYEDATHYLRCTLLAISQVASVDSDGTISICEEEACTSTMLVRAQLTARLATDLCHMNRKTEALEVIETLLAEPNAVLSRHDGRNRLGGVGCGLVSLFHRLSEPPRRWKHRIDVPALTILPRRDVVCEASEGKRVEDACLQYILSEEGSEFTHGMHCENGIIHTLFALLVLDYETPRIGCLDDFPYMLHSAESLSLVQERLKRISLGQASSIVRESWVKFLGNQVRGLNWHRNSLDELMHICNLLGPKVLSMICSLLTDAYDAWCGGVPDLLVWGAHSVSFVEVKGPGDSLSDRQKAWGEKLLEQGAWWQVYHVQWKKCPSS